jgi:hypothetical protein
MQMGPDGRITRPVLSFPINFSDRLNESGSSDEFEMMIRKDNVSDTEEGDRLYREYHNTRNRRRWLNDGV